MFMLINPGTGPVADSTVEVAIDNMRHFMLELGLPGDSEHRRVAGLDDGEGRFGFVITYKERRCKVLMPGVPLEVLCSPTGLPPRLYVDGSSWMWGFAISVAREALTR